MGMEKYILNERGEVVPASLMEWASWFETAERHVVLDKLGDVKVSTVFLGVDHNFGGGPPLLFETMIFGGPHDEEQWRYATKEEALRGHREACELAFATGPKPDDHATEAQPPFTAGLLAMREHLARLAARGEHLLREQTVAEFIRSAWDPAWGREPGRAGSGTDEGG